MKKNKFMCLLLAIVFSFSLSLISVGCGGNDNPPDDSETETETVEFGTPDCDIYPTSYDNIASISGKDSIKNYNSGVSDNLPVENGIIVSPYYTLNINDQDIEVYATRTANGIHSFVYIDVDDTGDKGFSLNVTINGKADSTVFKSKSAKVEVLPLSAKVNTLLDRDKKEVLSVIKDYGSFSFVFNESNDEPLTIMVTEKEDTTELFGPKTIKRIAVGDYSTAEAASETLFTEENTVYYFSNGRYIIDTIKVPSNSVVYLEQGAYLELKPSAGGTSTYAMNCNNGSNFKILGRGLIDYSACCGSVDDVIDSNITPSNKSGISFRNCDGLTISGITVINSMTWTLTMESCKNIQIDNLLFFAYRTYADGVMLSNCQNAVVEDSFIRTGDDAFETKSSSSSTQHTDNVLFQNNAVWTDKAVAYGCIYECYNDTRNVTFKNCSVGFASGSWSTHLGCCVIQLGQKKNPGRITENITFENIEIYQSNNQAILNCFIGGTGGDLSVDEGAGIIQKIYFKNITAKHNYGKVLNVHTNNSENCFINDLYLENIVSNGVKITASNIKDVNNNGKNIYFSDAVVGGYDLTKLFINGIAVENN